MDTEKRALALLDKHRVGLFRQKLTIPICGWEVKQIIYDAARFIYFCQPDNEMIVSDDETGDDTTKHIQRYVERLAERWDRPVELLYKPIPHKFIVIVYRQ